MKNDIDDGFPACADENEIIPIYGVTFNAAPAYGCLIPKEDPIAFDIALAEVGPNRLKVISLVRKIKELSLKDAVYLVDHGVFIIKSDVNKWDIKAFKKQFEDIGATVAIIPTDY